MALLVIIHFRLAIMILFKPSFVERLVWCVVWKGSNRTCWSSDLFGFPRRYYENVNVLWARKCYHTNTVWWLTFKIIWFKNISLLSSPHWLGDWRHVEECVPLKNMMPHSSSREIKVNHQKPSPAWQITLAHEEPLADSNNYSCSIIRRCQWVNTRNSE